ncbi:uncharacterized protein [Montipora foliosa]|uniref:uncharacterized protein n=1 Tax=Montipora foliosa TaxID=591990 RepID=UPI0035F1A3F6
MQAMRNSYLGGVLIVLLLFIRLGFPKNIFNSDISSKADEKDDKFLNGFPERRRSRNTTDQNLNKTLALVLSRFRAEMATLFLSLPNMKQSELLDNISKATSCSVSDIKELLNNYTQWKHNTEWKHNINDSFSFDRFRMGMRHLKTSKCVRIIDHKLWKMFEKFPLPFQCHLVNTMSMAYNKGRRRHLPFGGLTFEETQNAVQQIFPFVRLPRACADTKMDCLKLIPSIPPVNITVNLISGDKRTWLPSFSNKGPQIYRTLLEYEMVINHKDKVLGPGSTTQYLAESNELINSAQLIIDKVYGNSKKFSILFRLKVKRKSSNHLRELRSTYKIVHALVAKTQEQLVEILNANVMSISLSRRQSNKTIKSPLTSNKWTLNQVNKAKELFPAELSEYFKQLGKLARCFVVCHISTRMKQEPKEVEMVYTSFGLLSRKHTCFYTQREVDINGTITVTEERFTPKTTLKTILTATRGKVISTKRNDTTLEGISRRVFVDDFSILESALFTLLGLLCIIILAFSIYCLVLALKSSSSVQENTAPNAPNETALFSKGGSTDTTGSNGKGGVHSINMIHEKETELRQAASADQLNLAIIKSNAKKSCKYCSKLYSLQLSDQTCISDSEICSKISQLLTDHSDTANNRIHKENEHIANSLLHVPMEPLWKRRSSFKTACRKGDPSIADDRLFESQGEGVRYCETSKQRSTPQLQSTENCHQSLSEESQEMVVILLKNFRQVLKEEPV